MGLIVNDDNINTGDNDNDINYLDDMNVELFDNVAYENETEDGNTIRKMHSLGDHHGQIN